MMADVEASCREVDKSAVLLMSDEQLSLMGVCTIGDRLRLKAFCSPPASSSRNPGLSKSAEKEEKIEKVKDILNKNKRVKRGTERDGSAACPPKIRQKETLKFDFGWKHWVDHDAKYKLKRSDRGGGKRRIDVSRIAGYHECLQIAKRLFFPKGLSDEGHEDDMYLVLANSNGVVIETLDDESNIIPFSAGKYKEITGFTLPNVYLLSRSKVSVDEDTSDDSLYEPVFEVTPLDEQGNEVISQQSKLIGSSSERKAFFDDLERQVSESAAVDAAKKADQEAKEKDRLERIQEEITKAEKEAEALELVRMARKQRVPPEPSDNGVLVSVRHVDLGVLTRAFPSSCTMLAVYDWIGSLSPTPKHFKLTKVPNSTMYPDESVTEADKELLSMFEESGPLPLALDENEVTFYEGESDQPLASDATILDISDKPPEVLLEGDPEETATEQEQRTNDSYASLEARRKQEQHALETGQPEKIITISRHNITELMSIYEDPQISQHKLLVYFDEDSGSGDGVVREMFSLFWDMFVMFNCEGSSQFTISVSPAMQPQDYVTVGRILTHGFVISGGFPVQLARASLHQALFGTVNDECLLDSFLMLLPEKERETMLLGLNGTKPFPLEEIVDILDDFKETTMPSSANLRELLVKVGTAEFITKPFLPLLKLREGMGDFWNGTTKEEVDALYEMCCPTPTRVANHLSTVPGNPQEEKVYRWLKRYARNMETKMAVKFVRFCTASDVLLPEKGIAVRFDNMPEGAIRPTARTCFRALTVARNYRSFNHLKENFDFYLRDPTQWDLSD